MESPQAISPELLPVAWPVARLWHLPYSILQVFRHSTLAVFALFYFVSFAYCFGIGVPAGSLVPSVLGGAGPFCLRSSSAPAPRPC